MDISNIKCQWLYLFLDDFTHYLWVFPLRAKSEAYGTFVKFQTFVKTQVNFPIKSLQCDNSREYDNLLLTLFSMLLVFMPQVLVLTHLNKW